VPVEDPVIILPSLEGVVLRNGMSILVHPVWAQIRNGRS